MRVKLCSRRNTRIGSPIRQPGSPRNARSRRSTGHFGGTFELGVQLDEREIVQVTKASAPESSNGWRPAKRKDEMPSEYQTKTACEVFAC
jgi:hypothetical protein